jgi:hypothetical protein
MQLREREKSAREGEDGERARCPNVVSDNGGMRKKHFGDCDGIFFYVDHFLSSDTTYKGVTSI